MFHHSLKVQSILNLLLGVLSKKKKSYSTVVLYCDGNGMGYREVTCQYDLRYLNRFDFF